MKTKSILHRLILAGLVLVTLTLQLSTLLAQTTAFTYQGRLLENGQPANGLYDFRFALYQGADFPLPHTPFQTNATVPVTDGLFVAPLDFGATPLDHPEVWLEIGVRTNGGGAFVAQSPRQQITSAPWATRALAASGLAAGATLGVQTNAGSFLNAANQFTGSFTGSGAGLTALDASQLASGTVPDPRLPANLARTNQVWLLGGNIGITPGTQFLGTADNQPLELKVNNLRALRLEDNGDGSDENSASDGAPNLIGGAPLNRVAAGVVGATISGGGAANYDGLPQPHAVEADYGVVGGGLANTIAPNSPFATISGGRFNTIADDSLVAFIGGGERQAIGTNAVGGTISGGMYNTLADSAQYSAIGGGVQNHIHGALAFIGGGSGNRAAGSHSAVGGGSENRTAEGSDFAFIGAGQANAITNSFHSVVGGGYGNRIAASPSATIAGGSLNTISNGASYGAISGGQRNTITELSEHATVAGGQRNVVGLDASWGAIGGGYNNRVADYGRHGTVPGGRLNVASHLAFAAGNQAKATNMGAFVWADSTPADFASTAENQFSVRAGGGVRFVTDGAGMTLDGQPVFAGSNAAALTNLNASQLASGTLPPAQLSGTYPSAVVLNNAANSFSGDGSSLTGLNASQLASGAVPDARLAGNVARTNQVWLLGGNAGTTPGTHFLGTTDNRPLEVKVNGLTAFRLEPGSPYGAPNVIGGAPINFVAAGVVGAVIAGGGATSYGGVALSNSVWSDFGAIGGGYDNNIAANSRLATIAGGYRNNIGTYAAHSFIGGGYDNNIAADSGLATIAGGSLNDIGANSYQGFIGGGYDNNIAANSSYATIAGGIYNDIGTNAYSSFIGGGRDNNIADNSEYATIAGGYRNNIGTNAYSSFIGGGDDNNIADNSSSAAIAGGLFNDIGTNADYSFIGGGAINDIGSNSPQSTIGGGYGNDIAANSTNATIAGGYRNNIGTNASHSTIGGGYRHTIAADSLHATIAGGGDNVIGTNAYASAIGGGSRNTNAANGQYAIIPGGQHNFATNYAFASGLRAKANHTGAYVWGDSNNADIASTNANSVTMRASGGYRLYSNAGATAGVWLAAGSGGWTAMSDRNAKEDFQPVNALEVLNKVAALPVTTWKYKSQDAAVRHIGPVAQDFKAAFGVGESETGITSIDADGVALAAIQGLNQKLADELKRRDAENAELKRELAELKRLVGQLIK